MAQWEPPWRRSGQEPDYRFSLAIDRTFLAWIRSALALLAGGVLLVQFATRLSPPWLLAAIGIALVGVAGVLSVVAYNQWRDNEIAMRHAAPLPSSAAIPLLATLVGAGRCGHPGGHLARLARMTWCTTPGCRPLDTVRCAHCLCRSSSQAHDSLRPASRCRGP